MRYAPINFRLGHEHGTTDDKGKGVLIVTPIGAPTGRTHSTVVAVNWGIGKSEGPGVGSARA
jgi:hypothetical protein